MKKSKIEWYRPNKNKTHIRFLLDSSIEISLPWGRREFVFWLYDHACAEQLFYLASKYVADRIFIVAGNTQITDHRYTIFKNDTVQQPGNIRTTVAIGQTIPMGHWELEYAKYANLAELERNFTNKFYNPYGKPKEWKIVGPYSGHSGPITVIGEYDKLSKEEVLTQFYDLQQGKIDRSHFAGLRKRYRELFHKDLPEFMK